MSLFGKILILFSLIATLIAAAAAQVSFPAGTTRQQHAGCHQPAPPTPAPVSYSCCQAGHDSLLLLHSDRGDSSAYIVIDLPTEIFMPVDRQAAARLQYSASPPGEPSASVPLRV
ncbi:MAG TPA: hypothetical protein VFA68_06975 [Terriglobales bacterium]|nr:hypothetical protein [Terriglobales bacterium]